MTTVVRGSYYKDKNITKFIGLAAIDVLVNKLALYTNENMIKLLLQVTEAPFTRPINNCVL
jgi:hypothetical protein